MFCEYCRRLFSFQQPVQHYSPTQKRRQNILQEHGTPSNSILQFKIERSGSPQVVADEAPKMEVYEDTQHIFGPKLLWFKTQIGKQGLGNGDTHDPGSKCQICDMIFRSVSGSFVEGISRKQRNGGNEVGFVYQLKGSSGALNLHAVLSIWLEVGEKLLPMVKLEISERNYINRLPGIFPSRIGSTNTGSIETLGLAASWINHCNSTHRECARFRAQERRLPTRLVDVGPSDGSVNPRLAILSQSTSFIPYTTLSYRWGPTPSVLLTQSTLPSLIEEIPFHLLPKTNQDAIVITRFLGIRYLWIDALCIIQDLEVDWHKESARMGDIYKESYVTISASMADTGPRGCFVDRGPLETCFRPGKNHGTLKRTSTPSTGQSLIRRSSDTPFGLAKGLDTQLIRQRSSRAHRQVKRPPNEEIQEHEWRRLSPQERRKTLRDMQRRRPGPGQRFSRSGVRSSDNPEMTIRIFQTDLWASEVDASPLGKRAWTLQERLLSPRILHFTKMQVFFECPHSRACETWPQPAVRKLRKPFEEDSPVGFDSGDYGVGMNGIIVHPLPEHWDEVVELYTDTSLTRPEDKLVAISGLAREVQKETKDVYHAGLWRKDFERTLLWYLHISQRTKFEKYRAPSWSWAAVDGRVGFLAKPSGRMGDEISLVATIHTIRTVAKGSQQSSTGQVQDGFFRVSGTLRRVLRYERQSVPHRLLLSNELSDPHSSLEFFPDTFIKQLPADIMCLPILHYRNRMPEGENVMKVEGPSLAGLVIQPTGEFRDEYRRIGVFRIESETKGFEGERIEISEITII